MVLYRRSQSRGAYCWALIRGGIITLPKPSTHKLVTWISLFSSHIIYNTVIVGGGEGYRVDVAGDGLGTPCVMDMCVYKRENPSGVASIYRPKYYFEGGFFCWPPSTQVFCCTCDSLHLSIWYIRVFLFFIFFEKYPFWDC